MKLKNIRVIVFREYFSIRGVIDWIKVIKCFILERWIINSKSDVLEIRLDMYDKDRKLNRRLCIFLIFLMLFSC